MRIFHSCATLLIAAAILGGCCGGGSGTELKTTTITTTTGQQLLDLKKALDAGAIDEKQYEKMKDEIIKSAGGK